MSTTVFHLFLAVLPLLLVPIACCRGHYPQERKPLLATALTSSSVAAPALAVYAAGLQSLLLMFITYVFVMTASISWALLLRSKADPDDSALDLPEPSSLDWNELERWLRTKRPSRV